VIPVTYKPELDLTGVRWLEHNQPDIYRQFASCLTVTPAKPYIQVKEID